MYSACLYCHRSLGDNEVLETFPVGERIAFDAAKGRLWVVCPHCSRWCLSPLEERWEAVETCERRFRAERLRAQTDNIGLARLREGLTLVRIGKPLRPEFAAWRYGRLFGERLRRAAFWTVGGAAVAAGAAGAVAWTGVASTIVSPQVLGAVVFLPHTWVLAGLTHRFVRDYLRETKVPGGRGRTYGVIRQELKETELLPSAHPQGWMVSLRYTAGRVPIEGAEAQRALGVLLARMNWAGATRGRVGDAVGLLAEAGNPDDFIRRLAARNVDAAARYRALMARYNHGDYDLRDATGDEVVRRRSQGVEYIREVIDQAAILALDPTRRLALEMALHEGTEQIGMELELASLEEAWREAETIAGIADDLLVPPEVETFIATHRKR